MNPIEEALVISLEGREAFEAFCKLHNVTAIFVGDQITVPEVAWKHFLRQVAMPINKRLLTCLRKVFRKDWGSSNIIVDQLEDYIKRYEDQFLLWDQGKHQGNFNIGANFPVLLDPWLESMLEEG